jgi:NAD(P)-dependent dehydrogenase (short-subunit alcohol dehydrogenase family)
MTRTRLQGRIAVVTGGSRGIGAAIARAMAEEGAKVVIASRNQEVLDATAAAVNEAFPGSVVAKACHVGKTEELEALFGWTREKLGMPTVLVNNAGTNPYFGPLLSVAMPAWDKTFEVNLKGPFEAARLFARSLLDAGKPGSIINVSSVLGMRAAPMQGVYGMTKAALISLTQTLAVELGAAGIRINAIAPGLVDTKLSSMLIKTKELTHIFTEKTALKRYAQPEEMAGMAVFLASDESSYVTGQTFPVDGGYTAG